MRLLTGNLLAICLVTIAMAKPAQDTEQALRAVSQSSSQFSTAFTQKISEVMPGNLITSPLSANLVLAMAAYGAGGQTEQQFRNVLHLPQPDDMARTGYQTLIDSLNNVKTVTLSIVNKMYVNDRIPLKPSFIEMTANNFRSTSEPINFGDAARAATTINSWVKEQTHDRIDSIVKDSELNSDTALMLLNAVYFKGLWKYKFNPENTRDLPFHVNGETVKNVPTMYRKLTTRYGESQELDAKMLELPYMGDQMSMIILLPNKINGLSEVENKLQNMDLNDLMNKHTYSREVDVYMPKFKIESKIDLEEILQKMGLTDMFTNHANFSGISDSPLRVSKAVQKAFIEVNEEGSEAAGVTGIQIMTYSLIIGQEVVVDRPFVYAIVKTSTDNDSGVLRVTPLFTGHVVEPTIE